MKDIKNKSIAKLNEIRYELSHTYPLEESVNKGICVYACGSLGRLEMTDASDLDPFFIKMTDENKKSPFSDSYASAFIENFKKINAKLRYPPPSNNGEYWKFINRYDLLDIGSRQEDYNNSFTARMLLILESKPIYNINAYNQLLKETIDRYFKDYNDHSEQFFPLFLMNDIWRYWYTLTLNYEYGRDDSDNENKKNWKRLKLKFARHITCFSMLACLFKDKINSSYVIDCIKKTPFERLLMLAETIDGINEIIQKIEDEYLWYLSLRQEKDQSWWNTKDNKLLAENKADIFHKSVIHELMKLVSQTNLDLFNKTDIF